MGFGLLVKRIAPKAIQLGMKAYRFSRDGFDKDEVRELAKDFLEMGCAIIELDEVDLPYAKSIVRVAMDILNKSNDGFSDEEKIDIAIALIHLAVEISSSGDFDLGELALPTREFLRVDLNAVGKIREALGKTAFPLERKGG